MKTALTFLVAMLGLIGSVAWAGEAAAHNLNNTAAAQQEAAHQRGTQSTVRPAPRQANPTTRTLAPLPKGPSVICACVGGDPSA